MNFARENIKTQTGMTKNTTTEHVIGTAELNTTNMKPRHKTRRSCTSELHNIQDIPEDLS
jgi:hypothetical protein